MEKKRVSYYDLAKGLGIILVVVGHIEYISVELRGWISSFHMPLFFVISGMLIAMKHEENVPVSELFKKKFRGIMLPYYWFAIIYFPIDIFNIIRDNIDMHTFWWDQIYSVTGFGISVMWFLPALFVGEITALLLIKLVASNTSRSASNTVNYNSNNQTILSVTISFISALAISVILYTIGRDRLYELATGQEHLYSAIFSFVFVIFRGIILSVFIVFGYAFQKIIEMLAERKSAKAAKPTAFDNKNITENKPQIQADIPSLVIGIVLFILNIFMSLYNGCVDTHYLILKNLPMFYLCACTGSMALILICKGIGSIKFIEYFGKNSLIIMATHIQFFILYASLLVAFKIDQYTTFAKHHIFIFCTTACVMMLEIPFIEIINRFFPFILGKKFTFKRKTKCRLNA